MSERFPYVLMDVLLTAWNVSGSGCLRRSVREGGITLTFAHVSTKNRVPESYSGIGRR